MNSIQVNFKEYAGNLKAFLDEGFTRNLEKVLGNTGALQAAGGTKIFMGGKRVRGSLLCLVTETLGGELKNALSRAVAIEFIQTATLIHDDFIDQHESRRNVPALWTLEGARKAVLLGDIIFSSAIQMMSELGRRDGLIVSRAIAEVSKGVYQEPLNPEALLEKIDMERDKGMIYEKIIYLKTAILFGAACQLGAVAAGADDNLQRKWRDYGTRIGEAYQITDDLHDVERYIFSRAITESEAIAIAPAVIFFNGELRSSFLKVIQKRSFDLEGEILKGLQKTAVLMKNAIEDRLQQAISGIEDCYGSRYGRLAHKTPWDIIRLFNESEKPAS